MSPLASHICPKCSEPRDESAFRRKNGEVAGWCSWCRANHRGRLTRLRQRQEVIKKGFDRNAAEIIAKAEGYAGHSLANLLALSHIAGARRALAIRDGRSWRGKKAWGEYYRANRELAGKLATWERDSALEALKRIQAAAPAINAAEVEAEIQAARKRDPNSEPVSSRGEES